MALGLEAAHVDIEHAYAVCVTLFGVAAQQLLADAGYPNGEGFPTLTYTYPNSNKDALLAQAIQAQLKQNLGINITLNGVEDQVYSSTRAEGSYDLIRHSWTADYDDPLLFLMLWSTSSNSIGLGWGAHAQYDGYTANIGGEERSGLTWMESYDGLLYSIQTTADPRERSRMIHELETLLMSTGAVWPIYNYTDLFMIDDSVEGFFSIPLGYKYFMYCTVNE